MLQGKNLIDPMDFSVEELEEIFNLAEEILKNPKKYSKICEGKLLATLFYEPSTRTRLSFEAAMLRLGGRVLGFSDANCSSVSKGESLQDTIKIVSGYTDVIAIRHPEEGSAKIASNASDVPVINAGDGGHQHPTQTLTDLFTIKKLKGNFSNHTIGLCGDLKFGRTVHSLVKALSGYENNKFILISPEELKIPHYIKEFLIERKIQFEEVENLEDVIEDLDVLYMTRVQKERFNNQEEYIRLKDTYVLDEEKMKMSKKDMIVLHPLPRVNEIDIKVDKDNRACYFKQARLGMFARMALIAKLLGVE
ncbi:aspartate carbamoyltransferase [Clostridium botulinum]|uniref:Aspartate carbamoyltransferase n=1 Tax=Clostridium botulinum C/D str. DC5 TaxID=1443128 RepID=A0A0A0IG04_CLOBO|nr:aspartate carbamoyltransferase [Clostridium botulinum]KEI01723.1 aspartate carbamoyltransferase catalytic subunit [Clostridium botulinum C/D str. BKT75002]KEI07461.1 aspartate carbamoyltransferase catalytic subunit [Clostridium botulinum C/D str. BKT2873]KGM93249.1 aspartate carbamoyltransferase catalytic subunit [Clostridium botulinum D str. CCUG 7971]KGM99917.1 aspartate carbamoyltransferase catalytic subunit [Clostridium botulinum C/D str. DC5]KOC49378.1 aspartate carbamoyltransferase ca